MITFAIIVWFIGKAIDDPLCRAIGAAIAVILVLFFTLLKAVAQLLWFLIKEVKTRCFDD